LKKLQQLTLYIVTRGAEPSNHEDVSLSGFNRL